MNVAAVRIQNPRRPLLLMDVVTITDVHALRHPDTIVVAGDRDDLTLSTSRI